MRILKIQNIPTADRLALNCVFLLQFWLVIIYLFFSKNRSPQKKQKWKLFFNFCIDVGL